MAVDLTIELFAHELFNSLWERVGDNRRPFIEVPEHLNVESHITNEIVEAVTCRQIIFREIYNKQFQHTGIKFVNNPSNFLAHICVAFDDAVFRELRVCERIFATCAFVMEMSIFCLMNNNKYFLKDDFLCWAMYFDTELESEFYEGGGWKLLKTVAKSYIVPLLAFQTLNPESAKIHLHLDKYGIGMNDYCHYQTMEDFEHLTCAKSWVNYRLRNGKTDRKNIFNYETVANVEEFLTCLKYLCDPLAEKIMDVCVDEDKENFIAKFSGNAYLEKMISVQFSKLGHPTIKECNLQDEQEINPSEVLQSKIEVEQDLVKRFQYLDIRQPCNDSEQINQDLGMQKSTSQTKELYEFFENHNMKLSKLRCPENQNNNYKDLLISPSPEVYQAQKDESQGLINCLQAMEIGQQSNGVEPNGQAFTHKPESQTKDLNMFLENHDKKISNLRSLRKQSCNLEDSLETSPSRVFQGQTEVEQDLTKGSQTLQIRRQSNSDESIDQALTTQKLTSQTKELFEYLENHNMKLSKLRCPENQKNSYKDLLISPSPEVYQAQMDEGQGQMQCLQALKIGRQSNVGEPIDQNFKHKPESQIKDLNMCLENLDEKLLKIRSLRKQSCNLLDSLETSPPPEVFQDLADVEQSLMQCLQVLKIERQSNVKESIEQLSTTQKPMFQTNDLSNDSPAKETNISTNNCLTEDEFKHMWDQVMAASMCLDNIVAITSIQAEEAAAYSGLQAQDPGKNLLEDDAQVDQNDEIRNRNTGILQTYELWRNKLNMCNVHAMLNHFPVFNDDRRTKEGSCHQKKEVAADRACDVKENSNVKNETSQKAGLEREVQNVKKNKKKKKKTKIVQDDTKDILRMVFVLGWQPGVNYIRSTLQQTPKTTSV